jgi:DNA polymerase elongation subunit (family B)
MEQSEFFSYSWCLDEEAKDRTVIRIYGLSRDNENVCVKTMFTPYVYIELPQDIPWTESKAQLVASKLDFFMGDHKPINKKLMFKHRLYYAHLDEKGKRKVFPYLFCNFNHPEDIRKLGYVIRKPMNIPGIGVINLRVHEHNANPILQLTSYMNIPTAGWISFAGKRIPKEDQETYCTYEYSVHYKNLAPSKSSDGVARPLLMGYDIEVNSSIPSSMPKAHRDPDKIFQVSCVFGRQGAPFDTYESYLLTLGEPDQKTTGEDVNIFMYETEYDLLLGFTELIQEKQPNIIIGYNIFTFDIPYMIERARKLFCFDFDRQGMTKSGHARERTIEWSSSAYKNQSFQFLDAEGRIFVDLLPLVRRDYKMSNYQLKTIASHFLKDITKDPLDARGIFKCYRIGMQGGDKGSKALGIVGKYCVKDSLLVVRLFEVLTTWIALCEMSKVTNVPIFALYTQGQQLKVYSQVYKKCTHENIVVEKDGYVTKDTDHYIGATVFPPVPGVYDRVLPFDFSSLYPTTIIAYNICWSTLVEDEKIPDEMCHVMEWQDHVACSHDPKEIRKKELTDIIKVKEAKVKTMRVERDKKENKSRKEYFKERIDTMLAEIKPYREERSQLQKTKAKHVMCGTRRYRWLKEPMGVLPEILTHLLDARANTKKEMKSVKEKLKGIKEDDEEHSRLSTYTDILDQRQLALKVSANSVAGWTSIPCRISGVFCYRTIEQLSKGDWKEDDEGNELATPIDNLEVWSDVGFTSVKYIFRHKKQGNLVTVNTHTGCVDVTRDHSLLKPDGTEITSEDLNLKDELMHLKCPVPKDTPSKPLFRTISDETIVNYKLETEDEERAFIWGLFFAEGTCGHWGSLNDAKRCWNIYNKDKALLERAKDICERLEKMEFIIGDYKTACGVYHLKPRGDVKKIVAKYRELFYSERRMKRIPDIILNSPLKIRQAYFIGYYAGDGARHKEIGVVVSNKGNIGTAGLAYLARSLGYKVSVRHLKDNIYRLQCCTKFRIMNENIVKKMCETVPENEIHDLQPEIVRNEEKVVFKDGTSLYRNITIHCERFPRQKLLDSLDVVIELAKTRNSYITDYRTKGKKLTCKKYCCGTENTISLHAMHKNAPERNPCDCTDVIITEEKNTKNVYTPKKYTEYVYDIETVSHHFAAGVGDMIVHNSAYGALGVRRGYLPFMCGAMCTTYMGRVAIEKAAKSIQKDHGGVLVYGDSVAGDTPVLVKYPNDTINVHTIDDLGNNWIDYDEFKAEDTNRREKEQCFVDCQVWTNGKWSNVVKVIRHKTVKKMYRVLTHSGCVDVTEDHSLLDDKGNKVKPVDVHKGDLLLHSFPSEFEEFSIQTIEGSTQTLETAITELSCFEAVLWGVYMLRGKQVIEDSKPVRWYIQSRDYCYLKLTQVYAEKVEPSYTFHITKCKSTNDYRLEIKEKSTLLAQKYHQLFYKNGSKIIPYQILNSDRKIKDNFLFGFCKFSEPLRSEIISCHSKIGAQGLYIILKSLGYNPQIENHKNTYFFRMKNTGITHVKKIIQLPDSEDYVYDIETEEGVFQAGIGQLVLKNTDSNYVSFPKLKTAPECWDYAVKVAEQVSKLFPKPMSLAFENVIYWRYMIITKKRYMSLACERDGKVGTEIKKKGVLLQRRDNCNFIRKIYGDVVMRIFNKEDKEDILYYIIQELNALCSRSYSHKEFIITKSVGDFGDENDEEYMVPQQGTNDKGAPCWKIGDYTVKKLPDNEKDREKQFKLKNCDNEEDYYIHSLPAQAQLAIKMKKRGQLVSAGSRIEYVITNAGKHTDKQYIKVEDASYFARHSRSLEIDYLYYLKQLSNPLDQVLVLLAKDDASVNNFTLEQYKLRLIKHKMLEELRGMVKPKIVIKE